VLEVPLDHLMKLDNIHREPWPKNEGKYIVPYYLFNQNKIWGATAMVIAELLALLRPFWNEKNIPKT
jgi:predicted RNA-binding protein (virulence factor B family)